MRHMYYDIDHSDLNCFMALDQNTILLNHHQTYNGEILTELANYIIDEDHHIYKGFFPAGQYCCLFKHDYRNQIERMFIFNTEFDIDYEKINKRIGDRMLTKIDQEGYDYFRLTHKVTDIVFLHTAP